MKPNKNTKPDFKNTQKPKSQTVSTTEPTVSDKVKTPASIQWIVYGIILALCFVLYGRTIPYDYVLDDKAVITNNKYTKQGFEGIKPLLLADVFEGISAAKKDYVAGGRYRPLSLVTFAIEWHFFSYKDEKGVETCDPKIHHFINILLYAFTGMLIYRLLLKLFKSKTKIEQTESSTLAHWFSERWYLSIPFVATILFIIHPLHTEAIANIKGRDEIMTFLGALATLWFSIKYMEVRKLYYLLLSCVVFALALLSKENAVTFVAIVPLTIYYFDIQKKQTFSSKQIKRATDWTAYFMVMLPMLIATIAFMMLRKKVLGDAASASTESQDLMNNPFLGTNFGQRYATIFLTLGFYIKLLFVPHPLTFDYYPYHIPIVEFTNWKAFVPFIMYFAIGIYALMGVKKRSVISYGIWFYLMTFSIVSNVFFPIGAFLSERFMYISSLGFCIAITYILLNRLPNWAAQKQFSSSILKSSLIGFFILVLVLYSVKTFSRNAVWESEYTLFTTDINVSKNSAKGNYAAGFAYIQKGKEQKDPQARKENYEKGIAFLNRAIEIHPGFENVLTFLGSTYYEYNKDYKSAIETYLKVLNYYPNYEKVYNFIGWVTSTDATIPREYGLSVFRKLDVTYTNSLKLNPTAVSYDVLFNIGYGFYRYDDFAKAIAYFEQAYKIKPTAPEPYKLLGVCYARLNNPSLAITMFQKTVELNPADKESLLNIGRLYQQIGKNDEAQMYFQKAK